MSFFDAFFIGLMVLCFGIIISYNISETSKARKRLRRHEQSKYQQCN